MVKKGETTEGKVLGGFIMAATEYERAYQNQDNKQILFAKDLAPEYDFSSTEGTLDATAYGSATPTYQWYKDGSIIADATSATYTPTESGTYKCTATANGTTITTSEAVVTAKSASNGEEETTKTVTFPVDQLKTLDSNPESGEVLSLTIEAITIKAGSGISANKSALKISKNNGSDFTISANGAKITKITFVTNSSSKNLTSDPQTIPTAEGQTWTYDFSSTKPTSIKFTNASSSNINVTEITVEYESSTPSTPKTTLTATYSAESVSATVGDDDIQAPTLTVKAGETELTTDAYTVSYASNKESVVKVADGKLTAVAEGEATVTATVTPTDNTTYNGTTATFNVVVKAKATEPTSGTVYSWKTVGSQEYTTGVSESNGGIKFASDYSKSAYMTIKPSTGGFKAGDVITIKGYCNSKNKSGIEIHATADGESIFKTSTLASSSENGSEYTFTITEDCDALYIGRFGGGTTYITELTVVRTDATGKTRLTAAFAGNGNTITVVKKADTENQTVELPKLTVKAGDKSLTKGTDYNVTFKSNDENIVKYNSDNTVSILSAGTATITASVTPTNTTDYEGCTATYQITVIDPIPLKISTIDVTINTNDAKAEEPIIKVYDENDNLLDNSKYTLSYEVVEGTNVTIEDGKIKVGGSARNWTEGKSTIKVTATPAEAFNADGKYTAGTFTFTYEVNKGKKTPNFLSRFNGTNIKISKGNNRKITVPIVYNGEEVGQYFKYTYTSSASSVGTLKQSSDPNAKTLTFTAQAEGNTTITVSATPIDETKGGTTDGNDYTEEWNNPESITFKITVGTYSNTEVTLNPAKVYMTVGQTKEAPDVTVTVGGAVLDDDQYTAQWISSSTGVVKVDEQTGKLEAVSEGTADVRIIVNGDNMESTTAFLKVVVTDPAVYAVKGEASGETYKKNQVLTNGAGTMSVTLGGWMFPNPIKDLNSKYGTTSDTFGEDGWGSTASSSNAKITGFDAYVDSKNNQNARQENGSNAQVNSTSIYDAKYSKKGDIKDAMFNVPTSGSYLVFEPKTNGTVNAHIYQNGVFDKTTKKDKTEYQYRPQRRVFVVDEAGMPVQTEAQNQSTTGQPAGGQYTLSSYTWDLGTMPTTESEVMAHFKNLTGLKFRKDGFENGVYESNLPTDIAPNTGAKDDIEGSYGWCVLADAPVTYTFHVQAGKTYYLWNYGSKIGFYGFSFEEDENTTTKTVELSQTNQNSIVKTAANELTSVSINRSFKADTWTTCVLPFSLNKQQVDAIFGETYSSNCTNGTEILYFDRVEGNTIYFHRHAYNTIVAGKPFLIKPTKDVESFNTANVEAFPYVTIEKTGEPEAWCATADYAWISGYNTMNVESGSYYINNMGNVKQLESEKPATLYAFRGYLKSVSDRAKTHTLSVGMSSSVDDNGSTTIIEGLTIDANGDIIDTVPDGKVYNINGQMVSKDSKSFSALPNGVYIINGKKYIK